MDGSEPELREQRRRWAFALLAAVLAAAAYRAYFYSLAALPRPDKDLATLVLLVAIGYCARNLLRAREEANASPQAG
jgi:hypothetical protein